jgi:hypothetical protein
MPELNRREALRILGIAPMAALGMSWDDLEDVHRRVRVARGVDHGSQYAPTFFTGHEYDTVRVLVDLIIPRDQRSGSATDAGVPEFMDFILGEQTSMQTAVRGGLAWLDTECQERFGHTFLESAETERRAVLDDIAWPRRARPELSHGVAFFNRFRDLTASGFWSSRMGIEDLQYLGNRPVTWDGCPDEQLRKLGVRYE